MYEKLIARFIGLVLFMVATFAPAQAAILERDDHAAMATAIVSITRQKVDFRQATTIVSSVVKYAEQKDIDPTVILSMMNQESTFNRFAKSPDGSYGLMQVHYVVHRRKFNGISPFDIEASVRIGIDIFSDCMERNKRQFQAALNCYSGGGGKAYYQRFQNSRKTFEHNYLLALFDKPPFVVAGL